MAAGGSASGRSATKAGASAAVVGRGEDELTTRVNAGIARVKAGEIDRAKVRKRLAENEKLLDKAQANVETARKEYLNYRPAVFSRENPRDVADRLKSRQAGYEKTVSFLQKEVSVYQQVLAGSRKR